MQIILNKKKINTINNLLRRPREVTPPPAGLLNVKNTLWHLPTSTVQKFNSVPQYGEEIMVLCESVFPDSHVNPQWKQFTTTLALINDLYSENKNKIIAWAPILNVDTLQIGLIHRMSDPVYYWDFNNVPAENTYVTVICGHDPTDPIVYVNSTFARDKFDYRYCEWTSYANVVAWIYDTDLDISKVF
jgi:hypothetical protein